MRLEIASLVLVLSHLGPAHGKSFWSSTPASYGTMGRDDYLLKTGYPVGNGKLGAIPFGSPGREKINLNVDSLWSGGPFEVDNYRGGNPSHPLYDALPEIRSAIFENGTGDIGALLGNRNYYGSNRVLGNLTLSYDGVDDFTGYRRELDLTEGVHTTHFAAGATGAGSFTTSVFCSYPDQVCVYHIETKGTLPIISVGLENLLINSTLYKDSCEPDKGAVYHSGVTQLGPPEGIKYTAVARVNTGTATTTCSDNTLVLDAKKSKEVTIVIAADTNYNQQAGNEEAGWTFKGEDPDSRVEEISSSAAGKSYKKLLQAHLADYRALSGAFTLELTDKNGSRGKETAALIRAYTYDTEGDPFVDSLLFDYARHLLISSSRDNSLPANLQGRWTELLKPSWGADYHSNINIQMNYWLADQTGLAATQKALWNYIEDTWVPRGSQTAELLYNATGWVTHNEMNIFGFTAMKDQASWANYAISGAWMMQHVWDSFDYTRDVAWLETQGYPLIKGTAEFWLSTLQEDLFFEDGTLVVNPCNSAEHGPTTFGCTHFQQLIHQVFDAVLVAQEYLPAPDASFAERVAASLERLDTGLHFSTWGGIKEWKLPDSYGFDNKTTHRHLSHLNGWFPGYSIASFANGYANMTIQNAVRETLISRGMGNAADANAGWAKVWRSACWARLNETQKAYDHLRYAVDENFAPNGMSMYSGSRPPFQIDANFGYAGAMLAMLVVDVPLSHDRVNQERVVVLGPAIPERWGAGSVRGLRLRGGAKVDFSWAEGGVVRAVKVIEPGVDNVEIVDVNGKWLSKIKG